MFYTIVTASKYYLVKRNSIFDTLVEKDCLSYDCINCIIYSCINNITARANRTLGFLKRNLRGCKSTAWARAYEAVVRLTLEYAASIWDPHNIGKIDQLEKIQRRAARFTTRNYFDRQPGSVTNMIVKLGWEPLQVRCDMY